MARAGVLYEEVQREADEMLERGISPTIERLRQALGGGSFSTLSRHLRAWREARRKESERRVVTPPDAVEEAVQKVWAQMHQAAEARAQEGRALAEQAAHAARLEADRLVAEARQKQEQAEAALEQTALALQAETAARTAAVAEAAELSRALAAEQEGRAAAERRAAEVELHAAETQRHAAETLALERARGQERLGEAERRGAALLEAERRLAEERLEAEKRAGRERLQAEHERAAAEAGTLRDRIGALEALLAESRAEAARAQAAHAEAALGWSEQTGQAAEELARQQALKEALAAENRRLRVDLEHLRRERAAEAAEIRAAQERWQQHEAASRAWQQEVLATQRELLARLQRPGPAAAP